MHVIEDYLTCIASHNCWPPVSIRRTQDPGSDVTVPHHAGGRTYAVQALARGQNTGCTHQQGSTGTRREPQSGMASVHNVAVSPERASAAWGLVNVPGVVQAASLI
jgi:hypothetical protein